MKKRDRYINKEDIYNIHNLQLILVLTLCLQLLKYVFYMIL